MKESGNKFTCIFQHFPSPFNVPTPPKPTKVWNHSQLDLKKNATNTAVNARHSVPLFKPYPMSKQAISCPAIRIIFTRASSPTQACRWVVVTLISDSRRQAWNSSAYGTRKHIGGGFRATTQKETGYWMYMGLMIYYVFFWVFPRRLIVVCRCFGTLYRFHLQGLDVKYEKWAEDVVFIYRHTTIRRRGNTQKNT